MDELLKIALDGYRTLPEENWQILVLFRVCFMHVWNVDKEIEQNSRKCLP